MPIPTKKNSKLLTSFSDFEIDVFSKFHKCLTEYDMNEFVNNEEFHFLIVEVVDGNWYAFDMKIENGKETADNIVREKWLYATIEDDIIGWKVAKVRPLRSKDAAAWSKFMQSSENANVKNDNDDIEDDYEKAEDDSFEDDEDNFGISGHDVYDSNDIKKKENIQSLVTTMMRVEQKTKNSINSSILVSEVPSQRTNTTTKILHLKQRKANMKARMTIKMLCKLTILVKSHQLIWVHAMCGVAQRSKMTKCLRTCLAVTLRPILQTVLRQHLLPKILKFM
jgi:hypothetical protein